MAPKAPAPDQLDLFADQGATIAAASAPRSETRQERYEDLPDSAILTLLPKANLSNAEALAAEVLARHLGDGAVPALQQLWRRFEGFEKHKPLPEQTVALSTLAMIGTPDARNALATLLRRKPPSAPLLPLLLSAAAKARVTPPPHRLKDWLTHADPNVRIPAFVLACYAPHPDRELLAAGLTDPYPAVRREAAIAAGQHGQRSAKEALLRELARNPTSRIVHALVLILDDDSATHLGRCAQDRPELRDIIIESLEESQLPRAIAILRTLK